ncbi:MAG: 50S ribosomal protein L3 N(5)-glutamine methyltransferase [Gammaproteobacteria bacterium]
MNANFLQKIHTLADLLHHCVAAFEKAQLFYGHGTDNPWDEALALVLPTLQIPMDTDDSVLSRVITEEEKQQLLPLLKKRIEEKIPVPYITHEAWFMGYNLYVDERVLIPRSPFAELIAQQFSPWIDAHKVKHVLEIGTGSGCMAIACSLAFPEAQVDAVDIDHDALQVAKKNVARYQLEKQVRLLQGDLYEPIGEKRYDLIISNPPYVDASAMADLPVEYTHEPHSALASGEAGLDHTVALLEKAVMHLKDDGILIVEVGASQAALEHKYPHIPFIWLECCAGGEGIFLLTAEQVRTHFE